MTVKIGSARSNEHGGINGGKAGDQKSGAEVSAQDWYLHSKGWIVLRAKDPVVREKIAKNMEAGCTNDRIGYCQDHRTGATEASKPHGYDLSKVNKNVETDCSELVRICCLYAGVQVAIFSTANEVSALKVTGKFDILDEDKYCKSSDYLLRGDILVTKTKGHTVVTLSNGSKVQVSAPDKTTLSKTAQWVGFVTASVLNVRRWAGKENDLIKSWPHLRYGNLVAVCDSVKASDGSVWYYICIEGKYYGFVHSSYIKRNS